MKFDLSSSKKRARSRGVALITVLFLVVLITSIIIGFLITGSLEQSQAHFYKASSDARLMGDTAINLVQGQINEATTQGSAYAWASQPGAIRVYDSTGALFKIYRLYSAQNLTTSRATDMDTSTTPAGSNDMPPSAWATDPAIWVDLNAPANDGAGNPHYPIFNENRAANVDGFALGPTASTLGATATQVPMPVTWLYVLQNGEIIPPDSSGTTTATFKNATVPAPSASNPIVGRIAYWTDDETCKVNINTAGGDGIGTPTDPSKIAQATFWDTPRFCAPDDVSLAQIQPASGEFQRYPGHPATVALNNILNGLGWSLSSADFYGLLPRYSNGGSYGGTVNVGSITSSIPLKGSPMNRLYSSVSEMLFNYDRSKSVLNADDSATQQKIETAQFFLTAHSQAPEVTLFGQPRVSIWPEMDATATQARTPLDKLIAFSATNSGNAYYFTRKDPTSSSVDIGFSRNQALLKYLDYYTSQNIPGYGGNFDAKYGSTGMRQILTEIFDYIRTTNIADSSQPNGAGNINITEYAQPWIPTGHHSGMFEIAPSINTIWSPATQGFGIFPRLNEAAIQFVAMGQGASPGGSAVPLDSSYQSSPPTADFSPFPSLFGQGDSGTDPNNPAGTQNVVTLDTTTGSPTKGKLVPPGNKAGTSSTMAVQAFLLLSFINPAQMILSDGGIYGGGEYPYVWVEISGAHSFGLNGHSLGFTDDDAMIIGNGQSATNVRESWERVDFQQMVSCGYAPNRTIGLGAVNGGDPELINPFYSQIIPVTFDATKGSNTMNFTGGTITVKVYDGSAGYKTVPGAGHLIQTYTLTFPSTGSVVTSGPSPTQSFNVPTPLAGATAGPVVGTGNAGDRWMTWYTTNGLTSTPNLGLILNGDVVQSMVLSPTWSDARLLAIANVPSTAFVPDPKWSLQNFAYGFFFWGGPYYSNQSLYTPGVIMPNTNYGSGNGLLPEVGLPCITPTVPGGLAHPTLADWDSGLGGLSDGPWINKADEGVVNPTNTAAGSLPYFSNVGASQIAPGASLFSPNREMPSPGMFGSLSTGIDPTGGANPTGWRTLLFRPNPGHFGENSPEDHLLLDLFWMPLAEPYAISESFSSAGKVNLNYQIEPFTYITRSTALRAVLNPEKIAQVPTSQGSVYRANGASSNSNGSYIVGGGMTSNARHALDVVQTLTQFDDKFNGTDNSGTNTAAAPDIFHSASQICDMYLVPQGSSISAFINQWNDGVTYGLVGDNVRERPYANIYGQVTTKSNTFTIHYTVQSLKNAEPAALQNQWSETQGSVLGEYRGSTTIERYIDPNQTLPDFAGNPGSATVDGSATAPSFYRWRVVENHQFAP